MYHFGYGSNLQFDFLKTLLPSAKFAMKGYLLNHEVQFNFWSKKREIGLDPIYIKTIEQFYEESQ